MEIEGIPVFEGSCHSLKAKGYLKNWGKVTMGFLIPIVYQMVPNIHFFWGINIFQPHANCQIHVLEVVIGIGIRQCSNDPAASNWRKTSIDL